MNKDEYIVQSNELGGYDLILGSDQFTPQMITDLINCLKIRGIIPVEAKILTYINGITYMSKFKDDAKIFTYKEINENTNLPNNTLSQFSPKIIPLEKTKVKTKKLKNYHYN